jgi:two-component system sensor histidine kinase/response regulator
MTRLRGEPVNKNESPDKSKTRVLIVDDEYQICSSIAGVLDCLGYRSDFVHHPAGLREFLDKNHDVDIVLLDINLGQNISGIDLLPVIREKSRYTQVIMFTSEDRLEVGVECMRRGAYDYMTKPFMEQTFVNKAAGAVERKKALQLNDLYLGILFHDLKNPLQVIMSSVELLRASLAQDDLSAAQKNTFRHVERAISQILLMINNIVAVSKFERDALPARREPFTLGNEVANALAPLDDPSASPDHPPFSLRYSIDKDRRVVTDRDLFGRVLANIVSNALRYAAQKSPVQIDIAAVDGGHIQVSVTNTGSFIEEGAREAIFHKFSSVQLKAGSAGFQNYGLGLTFSKMAVEAMGGRIWITCDKAVPSTTFHFTVNNFNE